MSIWFKEFTVQDLATYEKNPTMSTHLGIHFVEVTPDSLKARMPINEKTLQPAGIMHGGASAALAETVGSVASYHTLNPAEHFCVGIDLNTSHLKMVKSGFVTAEAKPISLGTTLQVWQIRTVNDDGDLVALSRLTLMILKRR